MLKCVVKKIYLKLVFGMTGEGQMTKAAKGQASGIEPLLNVDGLAQQTGLTVGFIRKAIRTYGMPHYKIGKNVRFRLSEIDVWFSQRRVAG